MTEAGDILDPWWKRWFINPILKQLTQGISADKLAWTIAIGCAAGIFPVMGTTSFVCFFAAVYLRLNQPVIQVVCHTLWAAHLALILPFIKMGQWIQGIEPIEGSVSTLLKEFFTNPWQFSQDYWLPALHGIFAWFLVSIPLVFIVRSITLPLLRAAALRIERRKVVTT
jgi:uncharacterized protein (DUF2062 family)